jgi:uncharacterized protein involved in type VI secretion and phage assembly
MGEYTQDNRSIQITTPLGKDVLLLDGFHGQEGVFRLFNFELRMLSENHGIKFEEIVGKKATVKIVLSDQSSRYINGMIGSFAQRGSSPLQDGQTVGFLRFPICYLRPSRFAHSPDWMKAAQ